MKSKYILSAFFLSSIGWCSFAQAYSCYCPASQANSCVPQPPPSNYYRCTCNQIPDPDQSGEYCYQCQSWYYLNGDQWICDETVPTQCDCPDSKMTSKNIIRRKAQL